MSADPADALVEELLALATETAERAAALVVDARRSGALEVQTKSSSTDLVTQVDRAAEALIVRAITARRPDDAVLGEEGSSRAGTSGVRWVIDPIDGTTNFVYDHPGYAVSIAAEIDGEPAVGAVVVPAHGDVFTGAAGRGAWRNGASIRCSAAADLATTLVATGFSYDPARRARQAGVVAGLLPRVRDVRRMGAASVDLCSVACGRVDAYFERGLQPWDIAAGALIAAEAGAVVGDLGGGSATTDFTLAACPEVWPSLTSVLAELGADTV